MPSLCGRNLETSPFHHLILYKGEADAFTVNTLRPRQNDHHFPDDISKCIFLNENVRIAIKSLFLRVKLTIIHH